MLKSWAAGVCSFGLAVLTFSNSHAATLVWTNTAGGNWSTAANWSPNAIPASSDSAFITNSGSYTVTANASATIASLTIGDTNSAGTQRFAITAGTFTVTNLTSAANGAITLSAGTFVTAGLAELVGDVNQANGTWQLNTPLNINNYNLTNGELRGANCVITNLNWLGGSLNSDALGTNTTIPVGGTLTISGVTTKGLSYWVPPGRTLNNNGTATWSGGGINGQDRATINNNGTMTLNGDVGFAWAGAGTAPILNNNGTLTKASGSGAFTLTSIIVNNSNTVDIASGSLAFSSSQFHNRGAVNVSNGSVTFASSSGTNYGALTLGATSFADFNSGSIYTLDGAITSPTGDHVRVQGATVTLVTTNLTTPSLLLASGILNQATNVVVDTVNQNTGTWQLNVPVAINNYNLTNGELRGANITITNFNWLGGSLNSDALGTTTTIPVGGSLNISGATGKTMSYWVAPGRTLINNGTTTWSGAGITGQGGATIQNNNTLTLTGDFSYAWGGSGVAPVLNNNGTLTKASGAGAFTLSSIIFNNNNVANISSGSLTLNSSQFHNFGSTTLSGGTVAFNSSAGTNWGTLDLAASSFADFNSGSTYTLGGIVNSPSGDHVRVQGATVTLITTNLTTPSLLIASGQLTQGTNNVVNTINQNVGTWQLNVPTAINNYNLTNGELRGADVVITNFNWLGGSLNSDAFGSQTVVPNGGTLTISGATAKALSAYVGNGRALLNNGIATWSGAGITGYYGPQLVNNGTLTITGDFSYVWGGAGSGPFLINYTTLNLTSGSDLTLNTVNYYNAPGAGINFNTGSITFTGCAGTNAGLLNLDAASFVNFDSGTLRLDGNLVSPAGDHLRFRGMTVDLVTTNITTPSLLLAAGVLNQNTNVVVNTLNQNVGTWQLNVPTVINNYNLTNGELRGANNTITNFNWYGGGLNSDALGNITTIAPGGTLNISGATGKGLSYYVAPGRTLINNGTAVWSGAGITGQDKATIVNNATLTLASDFSLAWGGAGAGPVLRNNTTLVLSNGADFTMSTAVLDNSAGAGIYVNNGSITVGSGSVATNSGLLNLDATSFFQFSGATLSLGGAVVAPAGNSLRFAGTTAYIVTTNLNTPSLWQQAGTVYQQTNVIVNTYNQQAGTFLATLPVAFNNFNMTNAEIRGANVTITNFNWLGGALNADGPGSDTVTIPAGGTLNISGATAKGLSYYTAPGRTLINNGTATWSGAGITGQDKATILNNAALTLVGDFSLAWGGAGAGPVLRNTSSLTLSNGADFTLSTAFFDNQSSGTINFTNGSITVGSGSIGTNNGVLNLDAGSFFQFSGATLNLGGTVIAPANNSLRFAGTTAYITTTNIASPSFWQQGGTIFQMTNVVVNSFNQQAGTLYGTLPLTFNNYNMTNAELRGANVVITNFNWLGGSLNSENAGSNTVTIPTGGTLNISGPTAKGIGDYAATATGGRRLINNGTATWSGAGITGYWGAQLVNNNTWLFSGDFSLAWGGGGNGPIFRNTSSLSLSNGADFTLSSAVFDNQTGATISIANGSITIGSGSVGTNNGALNLDATSFYQFSGATLWFSGDVTAPAANSLRFAGTTTYVLTTNITSPSLWQQAGTIYQLTNIVVNTFNQQAGTLYGTLPLVFNNYNMTNAELRGANVTITNFNWLGGSLNGENAGSNTVTIPTGGTLNIASATTKTIGDYSSANNGRRLINNGTGSWSGAGITGYYFGGLVNQATLDLVGDFSLAWGGAGNGPVLQNAGTINLTSGADFSMTSVNFDNRSNGVINAISGSLTVGSGSVGTNNGTLNLDTTSFFQFSGATMYFGGTAVSPGNNSLRFGGTTAYIATPNITAPSIWQQAGTIYQLTNIVVNTFNQQAGAFYATLPLTFNNYNMTNAELRGANVTITNFNWLGGSLNSENAGSNTVTIPTGGTLNIGGATAKAIGDYSSGTNGRRLVNRGTGIWSGAGITAYWNTIISNIGTLTVTNDTSLAWGGGGGGPVLLNSGTFTKSGGAGAMNFSSAVITNSGTFNINSGNFALSGGDFTQTSGTANLGTNFSVSSNIRINAGTFAGRGSIAGTFYNNGLSSAGSPLGLITGTSWTNSATGTIRFELGGTNPGTNFDQFRLTGPATVNGTADLALANGFVPVPGNTFTCIVASTRSGVFTNLTFSGGYEFSALYTPTTVVFRAENRLPTVGLTVLTGNTQLVCNPFKLLATASDVGGVITNLSILQDGTPIANANSGSVIGTGESDFPLDVTFVAQAIDDQGGKSYATQTVSLTTFPLHVLHLGGQRAGGVFKFCMTGEAGSNYLVLATADVSLVQTNWTPLGLMENTNGIWRYYDYGVITNQPYRFYRTQQQ